ncbi:hypothetical protein Pse7367_2915 [Thalassoporum mexicanum PCC 7367]|nr:hypothetical protein Pse7367_2915 [Pseudanabaena sp. PCC 7367]
MLNTRLGLIAIATSTLFSSCEPMLEQECDRFWAATYQPELESIRENKQPNQPIATTRKERELALVDQSLANYNEKIEIAYQLQLRHSKLNEFKARYIKLNSQWIAGLEQERIALISNSKLADPVMADLRLVAHQETELIGEIREFCDIWPIVE